MWWLTVSIKRSKYFIACAMIACLAGCGAGAKSLSCLADEPNKSLSALQACEGDLSVKIDDVMTVFMKDTGVTAATVAIMKDGVVLYEQGYGFKDEAKQMPLPANALLVTASIVKPVTAAAIQNLAKAGTLALTDHAFCTGSNAPCWLPADLLPITADGRVKDITIQQLIEHQGGWDASISGDPYVAEAIIQQSLGLSRPPERSDIIRFVLAQPLDFVPGTRTVYSNFGYLLLGLIIEQAAKASYVHYVQDVIFQPLGISKADFEGAKSLLKDRNPREPNYITSIMAPSVFVPGTMVLATDGAIRAENWFAAGTVISTANAMAKFAAHYRIPDGVPLDGKTNNGGFFGADPGSATVMRQLPSGVSYAVLMNKLDESTTGGETAYQTRILEQIDAAISAAGF